MSDLDRTPAKGVGGELREKGSRFLAFVDPVKTPTDAHRRIEEIAARYRDATHICWCFRVGSPASEGCSDAGEPRGTAGPPMLQVLRGAELTDVVAVVARWFGGTKLGKGGLARAYAAVLRVAVDSLPVIERASTRRFRVEVGYSQLGAIQRLIHPPEVVLAAADYRQETSRLELEVHADRCRELLDILAALQCELTPLD